MDKDLTKKQIFKNISALSNNARNKAVFGLDQKRQTLSYLFMLLLNKKILLTF
ncbi:hypothetical protein [Chryseobacterium chendengshani]|uniref:hypothetical protein n=1 Tax=Chryseobacterium sp. LJ756 TaxID=2864113 RepID=UPI001C640D5E|nr:hypothetical protein [Chryseobacterium sp. LJ756]MBW7675179.1 hypothetical protein [Chryseobacterium sp. LJ756]